MTMPDLSADCVAYMGNDSRITGPEFFNYTRACPSGIKIRGPPVIKGSPFFTSRIL